MKRLLKVTTMTGGVTLLKMAMGFVIAKVVAVYTGPTGLAMLGQVQSLVGVLNGLINAPAGSGVVRYTAEQHHKGFDACTPWWRASFQWILIVAAIVIPSAIVFSDYFSTLLFKDEKLAWVVIATACMLPLSAVGTLCNSVINGQQYYRRYVCLGLLSVLTSSFMMLGMIIYAGIEGALLAAAIQSGLIGLVLLLSNIRQPWLKIRYWWGSTNKAARSSLGGYMLMGITSALTMPIALIFVRNIIIEQLGWDAAGQWQAVWKISEVYLSVITIALGTYYLPRLASLIGADATIKEVHKTAIVVIPIVALMALVIYLLRDVIILLLFTTDFNSARELFAVQLIGDVIKISAWLFAYPMLSRGATKWFICSELAFSISFVFLTYALIIQVGLIGASFAYLISYSLYFIFIFFNIKKIAS